MSRAAAEQGYAARRAQAFAAAQGVLAAAGIMAALRPIDAAALDAYAARWRADPARRVAWPWSDMLARYRRDYPARFELAAWRGGALCGLALGRPSPSPLHCALHYLEGSPDPGHPLRGQVTAVAVEALRSYAVVLGKMELRLVDPLPELVAHYQRLGFRLVIPRREAQYLVRETMP